MQRWRQHLCLLAMFFFTAVPRDAWSYPYDDAGEWFRGPIDCKGEKRGNPIRLNRDEITWWWPWVQKSQGFRIDFLDYDLLMDGRIFNNGEMVNMTFSITDPLRTPRVVITDKNSTTTYLLKSFHYHFPGGHWIDHHNFPLEEIFVHNDPETGATLALSYLFSLCSHGQCGVKGMETMAGLLKKVNQEGDVVPASLVPQSLMAAGLPGCGYFAYRANIPAIFCPVTWLIQKRPLCVEREHLELFHNLRDNSGVPLIGHVPPLEQDDRTVLYLHC